MGYISSFSGLKTPNPAQSPDFAHKFLSIKIIALVFNEIKICFRIFEV